jgi:Tfp pilus assembly protein PilN
MIRINLIQSQVQELPHKMEEVASAGQRNAVYAVASLVVCFVIVGFFHWVWNHEIAGLNQKITVARMEAARLAGIQAENARYEAALAQIESHIAVIEALEGSRTGPQQLMTKLGDKVDGINGLYLLSVKSDGDQLVIDGQSDHINAIAEFISQLQGDRSFQKLDLRQIFEDDLNNTVSFKFDLVCLYTPPVETAASMPSGSPTR